MGARARGWIGAAFMVACTPAGSDPASAGDDEPGPAIVEDEEPDGGGPTRDDHADEPSAPPTRAGGPDADEPAPDPPRQAGGDPPDPARFVEVTEAAGLDEPPGGIGVAPFCLLDNVSQPDQTGDLCFPEHFLGAAAVADVNGDGWPDIYITRRDAPDRLMKNLGDGTFVDIAKASGLSQSVATGAAAWLDIDNDGDLDLMTTAVGQLRHFLYVNDGAGHFTEEAVARGVALADDAPLIGMGIGVGDYDADGFVDLFVAEWHPTKETGVKADRNRLLRNRGADAAGQFEDRTAATGLDLLALASEVDAKAGVYGFAPAFVDLDGDGRPELALAADFGTSRLLWNDGAGGFIDATWASGVGTERNGMGSTFGDFDGDGDLDWFVSAIWTEKFPQLGHRLYRNEGARSFVDVSDVHDLRKHGWGWGAAWLDYDLDGDLDLAMAAGWPGLGYDADPLRIWENTGEGAWPERAEALGVDVVADGRGLVPIDYDRDGDPDLLVIGNEEAPRLFRNDVADGSWLVVRAQGTTSNRQSIGAVVRLQLRAGGPEQVRQIGVGSHLMGQAEPDAHFGLGHADGSVHRVTVHWPASNTTRQYDDVARDTVLSALE